MQHLKPSIIVTGLLLLAISFESCLKNDPKIVKVSNELATNPALGNKTLCLNKDFDLVDQSGAKLGVATIANDNDSLYMSLKITKDQWFMQNAYIYLGGDSTIPRTADNQPDYENFPITVNFDPLKNVFVYSMSNEILNDNSFIAIGANVAKVINSEVNELRMIHLDDGQSQEGVIKYSNQVCVDYPPKGSGVTVAFEDQYPNEGDADYNDFVVRVHVTEYYTVSTNALASIKLTAEAMARGAAYDHDFRINIPVNGKSAGYVESRSAKDSVTYSQIVTGDGTVTVSLFPHTKKAIPPTGMGIRPFVANTEAGNCLVPGWVSTLTLNIKAPENNIDGLAMKPPYDPVLYAYSSKSEIHVLELTKKSDADGDGNNDFWTINDKIFPFGIVTPEFWAWPLERVNILDVYPNFNYTENNNIYSADPNWYENPQGDTTYFKPEMFACPQL